MTQAELDDASKPKPFTSFKQLRISKPSIANTNNNNNRSSKDGVSNGRFSMLPEYEEFDQEGFFEDILEQNDLDDMLLDNSDDNIQAGENKNDTSLLFD